MLSIKWTYSKRTCFGASPAEGFPIFQMVLLWTVLSSKWDVSALLYIYRVHIHKHSVKVLKQLFSSITNALVKYKTFYFGF